MHSRKDNIKDLFNRYLENRCEPGEVRILLDYFQDAESEHELRKLIEKAISSPVHSGSARKSEQIRMFDEVHKEIRGIIDRPVHKVNRSHEIWPKIAAAAAILLIAGVTWFTINQQQGVVNMHEITTDYGEQREILLADGSTVFLNAGSTFLYPDQFISNNNRREVILENGEAYFDVNPNAEKPFVIQSGITTIRVVGTSFNVKSYQDDETSRVSVSTGEVEVRFGDSQSIALQSNQQAVWEKSSRQIIRSERASGDIGGWKENRMVFMNETLAEVFRSLERHYNVEISVQRPGLLKEKVTFSFEEQPLEAVLEALSFTKGFEFEQKSSQQSRILIR